MTVSFRFFKNSLKWSIFWHFWWTFVHSKCKLSSLRSQYWMRLFLWFSNIVHSVYCQMISQENTWKCTLLENLKLHPKIQLSENYEFEFSCQKLIRYGDYDTFEFLRQKLSNNFLFLLILYKNQQKTSVKHYDFWRESSNYSGNHGI